MTLSAITPQLSSGQAMPHDTISAVAIRSHRRTCSVNLLLAAFAIVAASAASSCKTRIPIHGVLLTTLDSLVPGISEQLECGGGSCYTRTDSGIVYVHTDSNASITALGRVRSLPADAATRDFAKIAEQLGERYGKPRSCGDSAGAEHFRDVRWSIAPDMNVTLQLRMAKGAGATASLDIVFQLGRTSCQAVPGVPFQA